MGRQSSKIKDFFYVSGGELQSAQQNEHLATNRTKSVKSVRIDYKDFKIKKYFKRNIKDEEVQDQVNKLEKKQDILKVFKFYEDFDRIDFKKMDQQTSTFEVFCEQLLKVDVIVSLAFSRILCVQYCSEYFSVAGWSRFFWAFFITSIPIICWRVLTSPEYHIVNHEYFRMMPDQLALKADFDLKLNLYKDVQDMKYNFKYPTVRQFYKTRRTAFQQSVRAEKGWYKEYFLFEKGLKLDPYEQFIKQREGDRKSNWQILTSQQRQQISKQIQSRNSN